MDDFPGKRGNRKRHSLPSLSLARTQPNTTAQSNKLPLCPWDLTYLPVFLTLKSIPHFLSLTITINHIFTNKHLDN